MGESQRKAIAQLEECTFPVMTEKLENTQKHGMVEISSSTMEIIRSACVTKGIDGRYLLMTAWYSVLRQLLGSETIHFGVESDGEQANGANIGSKVDMCLATIPQGDVPAKQALRPDCWALHDSGSFDPKCFNTGIFCLSDKWTEGDGRDIFAKEPATAHELCDIVLLSQIHDDSHRLWLLFRTSTLSDAHASNVGSMISQALLSILHDSSQKLGDIDIVTPDHRNWMRSLNDKRLSRPVSPVSELIYEQCMLHPDSDAVDGWDGKLTFRQLWDYASRLSAHLKSAGVVPGTMLPFCFEKSVWAIVVMLAVNQTGAAFVPLDPSLPDERLKTIIGLLRPRIAVASSKMAERLQEHVSYTLTITENFMISLPQGEETVQNYPGVMGQPAYCLFTSGSTGVPKGCLISHETLANVANHNSVLELGHSTRVLQFASYAFTISLFEVFGTLSAGGTVCEPSDHDRYNDLLGVMNRLEVNWAVLTPTTLRLLQPSELPHLRTLVTGGEPSDESVIRTWGYAVHLLNSYGMTECSGICSVTERLQTVESRVDIGKAPNARHWLVTPQDHTKLAPIGAVAELIVEGPCVAMGYLDLPGRTAEVFIPPPPWRTSMNLEPETGSLEKTEDPYKTGHIYKTGDLVRYAADGHIHYVGRKDLQVKIRGQRLELGDIEYHIAQLLPSGRKAIVQMICPQGSSRQLLAALIPTKDRNGHEWTGTPEAPFKPLAQGIASGLKSHLPSYMIPEVFIPIRDLPVTWSGKTNRKELRERVNQTSYKEIQAQFMMETDATYVPVSSQNEITLQAIWATALDILPAQIGAEDNFFHLGGDSIAAMKTAILARSKGLQLTVSDIFSRPRLRNMASKLGDLKSVSTSFKPFSLMDEKRIETIASQLVSLGGKQNVADILPVTSQQGFYISHYSLISVPFLLKGPVDAERLRRACKSVMDRHSILRTIFVKDNNTILQVIMENVEPPFDYIETNDSVESACQSISEANEVTPLFSCGLPFLVTLVSSHHEHALIVRLCHAQFDTYSAALLFQDMSTAYNQSLNSLPSATPFASYVYFSHAQKDDAAFQFWERYLHGSSITHLPPKAHTAREAQYIQGSAIGDLPSVPAGMTPPILVNAALTALLSEFTSRNDIVFGLFMNSRDKPLPQMDTMFGPCTGMNPLRVDFNPTWTVMQLCESLQRQYLQMCQFDYLDWPEIVARSTNWPSEAQLGCLVNHIHHNMDDLPLSLEGTESRVLPLAVRVNLDERLLIRAIHRKDTLEIVVVTSGNLMDMDEASSFAERLLQAAHTFGRSPNELLSSLSV